MKYNIKKLGLLVALTCCAVLQGCSNGDTDVRQPVTAATEQGPEEGHKEGVPVITSLTGSQMEAVGVQLGTVEYKELNALIKANGALRVPNDSKGNATSLYGGVIKSLDVQVGDYVKKGAVIATIANPQFIQLQEEYLTLDSRITLAEQELQRQQELNAGHAGAMKNLQAATAEVNTLRTRKASLKQQIQLMGINPAGISNANLRSVLTVTSPLSGTVSNVYARIGSYVDVSSPVIEIINNGELHLDLQIFERDLPKIKAGQTIHFNLTNNPAREYDARVFNVGSSFENDSKTIAVHARVLGDHAGLIDGMNITGMVSIDNVTGPAVPDQAIVEADGKYYVFIQSDKEVAAHPEEAGHDEHQHTEGEGGEEQGSSTSDDKHGKKQDGTMSFEKVEIVKGVSDMGYTSVTFIRDIPAQVKIVTRGAFFINAKLNNTGGHEH